MRELWGKIAHTGGATILTAASSVVSLAITARVLGPDGRGIYAAALSWVGLFATFGSLSVGPVIIHHVAGRPSEEWLSDVTASAAALTMASAVAGWLVLAVLYLGSRGRLFGDVPPGMLALLFVALPCLMWTETGRYILTSAGALTASNRSQILGAVVGVGATALLVAALRTGLPGAAGAYVAAALATAGGTFLAVRRRMAPAAALRPRRALAGLLLRGGLRLHLNAVGTYLFTQSSVLILNYYRPPAETAYYQIAIQLFGLALILSTSIAAVSYELVARDGPEGAWPAQRRLLLQALGLVVVVAGIGYALAPFAITLVAGREFLPAVPLFRVLLLALVGATFSSVMASQWIGRGLFLQAALLTVLVGIVSLVCDLLLIPTYGARGALVSTLVAYGISVAGNGAMAAWIELRQRRAGALGTLGA